MVEKIQQGQEAGSSGQASLSSSQLPPPQLPQTPLPAPSPQTIKRRSILEKVGLGLGATFCGLFAIALLPFSVVGGILMTVREGKNISPKAKSRLYTASCIISLPLVGALACIKRSKSH